LVCSPKEKEVQGGELDKASQKSEGGPDAQKDLVTFSDKQKREEGWGKPIKTALQKGGK